MQNTVCKFISLTLKCKYLMNFGAAYTVANLEGIMDNVVRDVSSPEVLQGSVDTDINQ